MKEILKFIKQWAIVWVSALIIFCAGVFVFIKARTSTNPWLSDTTPNSLYVNNNETLSAAKRNTMVKSTRREDVSLSDTASFSTDCERRTISNFDTSKTRYFSMVAANSIDFKAGNNVWATIKNWTKWTISRRDGTSYTSPTAVIKLQKKCQ